VVRLPFRLTNFMLLCFLSAAKKLQNPLEYWGYRPYRRELEQGSEPVYRGGDLLLQARSKPLGIPAIVRSRRGFSILIPLFWSNS
jgi:hypothetical protein